ncbi:MAG: DinB family protein [Roseiflexaceae bacterium]
MMQLDFSPVRNGLISMNDFAAALSLDQLGALTSASIDRMLALLETCTDADVVFVPDDPAANDDAAADPADRGLAWTLGHNIVHATASGEEYAAVATELARGVPFHGRPRYETPWQSVTTVAQCRQRLEESRRIRLASLGMWPDVPHLDNGYVAWSTSGWVNAKGIFVWGLAHDADHERQMRGIIEQAQEVRLEA